MNPTADALHRAAQFWVNGVVHSQWQASMLALVVLVTIGLTGRCSSHLRYALLLLALVKFVVPPFAAVPFGLFSQFPMPGAGASAHRARQSIQTENATWRLSVVDGSYVTGERNVRGDLPPQLESDDFAAVAVGQVGGTKSANSRQGAGTSDSEPGSPWTILERRSLPLWWLLVHATGGVVVGAWIARQYRCLARLARGASEVRSGPLFEMSRSISRQLGLRANVRLLVTDEPVPPMGFGLVRPVVLLPGRLLRQLSPAEQRSILAHELAHHRRGDQLVLCLQSAVICLWWFNPLVWLLSRAIHRCREECCDDRVLHDGLTSQDVYRETLARIAEYMAHQERRRAVFALSSRMHPLASRVARVLSPSLSRSGRLSLVGVFAIAVLACFVLPGSYREQLAVSGTAAKPSGRSDEAGSEPNASPPGKIVDLYGDPLPDGALVRLGTIRFRPLRATRDGLGAAFVGDGRNFITTCETTIRVWDRDTGKMVGQFPTDGPPIQKAAVSADGLRIAIFSRRVDPDTGPGEPWLQLWSWHGDDRTITRIWKRPLANFDANCLTFTADRRRTVVAGWDGDHQLRRQGMATVRFLDAGSGKETETHAIPVGQIEGLAMARTGRIMAIASRRGVWLWDWETEVEPMLLGQSSNRSAAAVEFSPDDQLLATISNEKSGIRLWNVKSHQLARRFGTGEDPRAGRDIKFTSDGRQLIVLSRQKGVQFWDVVTGTMTRKFPGTCHAARTLALAADGHWLAVASEQLIEVWNLATGKRLGEQYVGHAASARTELHFSEDGRSIVTASRDGTARIWDADSGRQTQMVRHERAVQSAAVSPDGRRMATSGMDNAVNLWDVQSGRRILSLPGHGQLGGRRDLRFSADGDRLFSWGDDLDLRIWDARTGTLVAEHQTRPSDVQLVSSGDGWYRPKDQTESFFYHWTRPKSGEFSSNPGQLVMSYYGTLDFCDVATGQEVRKLKPEADLDTVVFARDGKVLVTREIALRDGYSENTPPWREEAWRTFLRIRDDATLKVRRQIELRGQSRGALAVAPDGKLLAISVHGTPSSSEGEREPWIRIFETGTGREYARIRGLDAVPVRLAFGPDARRLASSHDDTSVLVWDIEPFRMNSAVANPVSKVGVHVRSK